MPTREIDLKDGSYVGPHLNKSLQFGNLATLIMFESRATARTNEPVAAAGQVS